MALCNVVGSSIAREADGGVYLHAGPEIGVASTKAFTAQVTVLTLLALYLGRIRHLSASAGKRIIDELRAMPDRRAALLPLRVLLEGLPRTELDAAAEARLRNGQALKISGLEVGMHALYRTDGAVIGLGEAHPEGSLKALRLTQAAEKHRKTL